ncbi:Rdx family-domain-containing protein [Parachaetomium inaequale]|uniref:Rdx family-domain-containing protein n=1 Tax=Parachaetomium inaequale TaxID=2588326 RepID=A0AAN6PRF7_9PEZI|nr:Rdx family-domain-containing protein [Parachaetomium inaequale]
MAETTPQLSSEPRLPRVTIQFCTQCKWMLRAAYYAQELLSTFSLSLGEVAMQPATGGVFLVEITTAAAVATTGEGTAAATGVLSPQTQTQKRTVLWDRKTDGGFPETKELKRRVRDVIQPGRDLGHVDRDYGRGGAAGKGKGGEEARKTGEGEVKEVKKGAVEKEGEGEVCNIEGGEKCEDCE